VVGWGRTDMIFKAGYQFTTLATSYDKSPYLV
jgi:hypothetical protein